MKKIILLLINATLVIAISACGGNDNNQPQQNSTLSNTPTSNSPTPSAEAPKQSDVEKTPLDVANELAAECGGTDVMQMEATMIGGDSGASFKIGTDKFEIYSFSDKNKLEEAKSGSMTLKMDGMGAIKMQAIVNGNLVLLYKTANDEVIEAFSK